MRLFSASLLLLAHAVPAIGEELVDRVVAIVNGKPILHSEIEEKVESGLIVTVSYFPAEAADSNYQKALEDEINMELILQKAEELGIEVTEDQVEKQIDDGLRARGLTREGLLRELERSNFSFAAYKENYLRQMVFRHFQGMVIRPAVKITDKDVETYYLKKSGSSAESVSILLRQIVIKVPDGSNEEIERGKHKLARTVHQKIESGMPFEEAVRIFSDDDSTKATGGSMGKIRAADLAPMIRDAIKPLDVGQYSQPVRTPIGFHIFKLESKEFSGSEDFMREKDRLESELVLQENESQTKKWLSEQRRRSEVKTLQL